MQTSIQRAKGRAREYWEIDGLPTIATALGVVFAGLWFWYFAHQHSWLSTRQRITLMCGLFWLILMDFKGSGLIAWAKARITYPRTGYVAPLKEPVSQEPHLTSLSVGYPPPVDSPFEIPGAPIFWYWFLAALWAAALIVANPWICVAAGTVTGMALWWPLVKRKFASRNVIGICCLGMWGAVFLSTAPGAGFHPQRMALSLIFLGVAGFFKGVFVLLRYLRGNPLP